MKKSFFIIIMLFIISCKPQSELKENLLDSASQDYIYLNQPYSGYVKTNTFLEESKENLDDYPSKFSYNEIGLASWYGHNDGFHGKKTANGDKYNKNSLTAAHRTLPMPCMVKVTNLKNGHSVILMINDRGPTYKNRVIDVSEKAAKLLDFKKIGITKVKVEYLPKQTEELLSKLGICAKNNKCKSEFFVQVGAFKNRSNANKMAVKLQEFGDVNINKNFSNNIYRVHIGPFQNKQEANKIKEQISSIYKEKLMIIEKNS